MLKYGSVFSQDDEVETNLSAHFREERLRQVGDVLALVDDARREGSDATRHFDHVVEQQMTHHQQAGVAHASVRVADPKC